ncbi:hypothetical protein CASFOL_023674 [Castilleja foliolosa]|uniref:Diacylglycerol O-acyltransferase n=1 Tax=Castilleja foliolosa TaxID=1961234 RepID=A0ABD3CL65_9LAMI
MSQEEEDQPASPLARMLQAPTVNLCVLTVLGFKTTIDVNLFKQELQLTLLKHPRFSSVLIEKDKKRGEYSWRRTKVDIENHVFIPDLDYNMESPDEFVEDFMSETSKYDMDMTRPLWEFYILNVKTSKANSTIILKTHHSIGDGVSLISLLMACAKKTSESNSPTIFSTKKKTSNIRNNGMMITRLLTNVWTTFLIYFNTLVDMLWVLATIMFLKDSKTPIKGERGVELSPKRFVHRIIDFDDIKLVKTAMNVSVNDVATGVAKAGLTRYLKTRYGQQSQSNEEVHVKINNLLPKNLRLTSIVCFNLRQSPFIEDLADIMENEEKLKGKWGNIFALAHLPLMTMRLQDHNDPLAYIHRAKAAMDRKKLSLEHICYAMLVTMLTKFFGMKSAAAMTSRILWNTTLLFSNMMGPPKEIAPFGHPLCYIAPTLTGFPQALVVHFQSYADKFIISIAADEKLIPNPHKLCDDIVKSLEDVKDSLIKRGFI